MTRSPSAIYLDPLEHLWLATARRIGLRIERTEEVYASTDGAGTLTICSDEFLDVDDSLAQMVFHELCHSLIEGAESFDTPDWGLDNETERDLPRERACLKVQAALSAPLGLRWFLAPTTDHRAYYDALPDDPLAPTAERETMLARIGLARASRPPWAPALAEALAATAVIVHAAAATPGAAPSLYDSVEPRWPAHPIGFTVPPYRAGEQCGGCGWRDADGQCLQAEAEAAADWPGCERWEPALECLTCSACCGPAYHTVELAEHEPLVQLRPDLVIRRGDKLELRRVGNRCAALADDAPFTCSVYQNRPSTCHGFAVAGEHCLTARRRVGLSR